ncbi:MAG TPA: CoA ester lyase [Aliidongia sp.]|uniref:HpcH/HpaI aldolase/citrate lyase family protein n=1 Tax=Aliidongia sp. TaxID=1914230 RepID=UPI002DDCC2C1|nr:CoA ester lyase [Aliidongia sp.]HEV2676399.1 CoA ester lyase [Aliidongia sp.]
MVTTAPRSLLFVPATSPHKAEKAFASQADGVIVDLEDAVALAEKAQARLIAADLLKTRRPTLVFLRVNAITSPNCFDDLQVAAAAELDGIVLPKAESAAELAMVDWVLAQFEAKAGKVAGSIEIMPIVETARGLAAAAEIAGASKRVRRLAFGAVDLALDMDIDITGDSGPMAHARFALALASRQAGLQGPMDTVFVDIRDLDGLRASAGHARAMGFSGKACIHPAQLETVNGVFTPSDAELARAREIVAAFEQAEAAGAAAVSVGGVMVDYPVVEKARRVLAKAQAR